ncbi:MAG TPA: family 1 glycosylhydrolase [Sphaerochaeta sp.]|nr:family 1 glycosylhydrolase [Sphaerochaeta sp.]
MRHFPDDFIFGSGTSAYQIEGSMDADGKSPSIWDAFCSNPENIYQGHTGEVACDHYRRHEEDIAIMQQLGLDSYRFSISWPRIYPQQGVVNQRGIAFYRSLVEKLLAANIRPMVTLNHWDIPLWVYEEGGWLNRQTIAWFADYARTMFNALDDLVDLWVTHNEPFVASLLGYYMGLHAPGHTDLKEALTMSHHLNLSHAEAVRVFRTVCKPTAQIGLTLNISPSEPIDQNPHTIELARRADGFVNRWFLDPIFKGEYPADMVGHYEKIVGPLDFIQPGDQALIDQPMDFFGLNFYQRNLVDAAEGTLLGYRGIDEKQPSDLAGWNEYPDVLLGVLRRIRDEYTDLPIIVTENGMGLDVEFGDLAERDKFGTTIGVAGSVDYIAEDGKIHDDTRIAYVHNCLRQCLDFIEEGGNLKGYYLWSLLDNFEWALGYSKRFGITYVDFETQQRTIKESGHWYASLIKARGL